MQLQRLQGIRRSFNARKCMVKIQVNRFSY
jgi:hypothetical protein